MVKNNRNARIVDSFNELATAIIIQVRLLTSTTIDKKEKDDKGYDDKITTA